MALQDVGWTEGSQRADRIAEEVDGTTNHQLSPAPHTTTGQNGTLATVCTAMSTLQDSVKGPHSYDAISVQFPFSVHTSRNNFLLSVMLKRAGLSHTLSCDSADKM